MNKRGPAPPPLLQATQGTRARGSRASRSGTFPDPPSCFLRAPVWSPPARKGIYCTVRCCRVEYRVRAVLYCTVHGYAMNRTRWPNPEPEWMSGGGGGCGNGEDVELTIVMIWSNISADMSCTYSMYIHITAKQMKRKRRWRWRVSWTCMF